MRVPFVLVSLMTYVAAELAKLAHMLMLSDRRIAVDCLQKTHPRW